MWPLVRSNLNYKAELKFGIFQLTISFLYVFISCNFPLIHCSGEEIYLTIPALGRTAHLGYMYDAVKDEIIEMSIFRDNSANDSYFVKRMQTPSFNNDFDLTNTFVDKIRLTQMNLNSGINILSGITEPEGSSRFLTDKEANPEKFTGVFLYNYKFLVEDLQILSDHVKDLYYRNVLFNKRATHIITGITWGANIAVTLDFEEFTPNKDFQYSQSWIEIQKSILKMELQNAAKSISDENSTLENNYHFSVYTDISTQQNNLKNISAREVQKLLKKLPEVIQETNGGKGVPVQFKLTPISILRNHLAIQVEKEPVLHPVNDRILREILAIFHEISVSQMYLSDILKNFYLHSTSFLLEKIPKFEKIQLELNEFERDFKYNIQDALIQVRSGKSSENILSNFTRDYYTGDLNLQNIQKILTQFTISIEKNAFRKFLETYFPTVEYFGITQNLNDRILQQMPNKPIYMMFTTTQFIQEQSTEYRLSANTFFHTLNKPYNTLLFIDCDFPHPDCDTINKTVIKEFTQGNFTFHDVNTELKNYNNLEPLKIPAIGRPAQLGELYNARTETFLGTSLLSLSLSSQHQNLAVTKTEFNLTETINIPTESFRDKFKAFKIDPELQFSILAGLVPLQRDAQYLLLESMEEKHSLRLVQHSGIEQIDVWKAIQEDLLNIASLHDSDKSVSESATHFVSQIFYGSSSVFSVHECTSSNTSNLMNKKLLWDLVKSFVPEINSQNNDAYKQCQKWLEAEASNLTISVFSSIQNTESSSAIKFESEEQLLNFMTKLFIEKDEQPITYILYPIENLRAFGILRKNVAYRTLFPTGEDPLDFGDILKNFHKANEDIIQLKLQMEENFECITDTDIKNLNAIAQELKSTTLKFKQEFKNIVTKIRAGAIPSTELQTFRQEFMNQEYFGDDGKYKKLKKMSGVGEKINLLNHIKKSTRIQYLGRETTQLSFDSIFMEEKSEFGKIYILYYKPEWTEQNKSEWLRCTQLFFGPLSSQVAMDNVAMEQKLYVINCEFNYFQCENLTQSTIHAYRHGKLVSTDYIESTDSDDQQMWKWILNLNSTLEGVKEKINVLMTSQNKTEILTQGIQNNIAAVINSTNFNRNSIEAVMTLKNKTEIAILQNENTITLVQNSTTANRNAIETLVTGLQNVSDQVRKNSNKMQNVSRLVYSCEFVNTVTPLYNKTNDVQNLDCGGLVNLPQKGSLVLRYKFNGNGGQEQRCLWTLHSNHGGKMYQHKLNVSLLCGQFGSQDDTLTFYEWYPYDSSMNFSFCDLRTNTKNLLPTSQWKFRHYLYLNTRGFYSEAEIIVKIDVLMSNPRFEELNWSFETVPGRVDYDTFVYARSTSITVVPPKTLPIQFTVEQVNAEIFASSSYLGGLSVYELEEGGKPKMLGRLVGEIRNSVSYATKYPVIAVFYTAWGNKGTYKVSWK